jgi:uncharacterized membrane protein
MTLLGGDGWLFLLRWIHLVSGVIWLSGLYHWNLVQTPVLGAPRPPIGNPAGVWRSLWWSRWGAMIAFLSGWPIVLAVLPSMGGWSGFYATSYGWAISLAIALGTVMWANVWFVTWPAQKRLVGAARNGLTVPDAEAEERRVAIISRTNGALSIPMLFFMTAASHLTLGVPASATLMIVISAVIIAAVEIATLMGSDTLAKKLLNTGNGTLWVGGVLAALFYLAFELLKS